MKKILVFLSFLLVFTSINTSAQDAEETKEVVEDDLGNVTDEFQDLFFKAIKLRAIENYEQAIETLNKCKEINAKEGAVYVELGQNYMALEDDSKAQKNFEIAVELLEGKQKIQTQLFLFQAYRNQKKYKAAADLAQVLIVNGEHLEVELIEILMLKEDFELALQEIEKLESQKGFSQVTDNFRDAIYKSQNKHDEAIAFYQNRIAENPYNEDNYFRLINFYKFEDKPQAILETAKALERINPLQDELPFILSMVYLEENQPDEAFKYSKKVLSNNALDETIKTQLIQSLKVFVANNPSYQASFLQLLDVAIEEGESSASNEERGEYFMQRDAIRALEYYQKALIDQPNNFELHQKIIVLQLKQEAFQEALVSAENAIEVFPSQAVFYYFKGRALYSAAQYDEAISVLEEGLDYLFETSLLEIDLLELLSETYSKLGNATQAETYRTKANNAKKVLNEME
jgi:tetratricopeptide (TPR) repeat protein